ncbi:acyl-CoA dehydrogenase family protein [Blastococcus sp. BMG 814]|uniref:Acyl-CoA dehydrogenase family protein n=1 Tax=Blastococcus carthaginiensis TaxID=3050034 RepID=A0ABT9IE95_9ACTN|nr:acyl-CoA dehydrogenase family protein [Blastococcus carthaginiensis]MDP5183898.1 acyl-CoA dehydrogenase family protein [Blastococcus carthaginiensis]
MRYDFSDEQQAFRSSVRRLFERRAEPARLRSLWDTDTGRDPQLWADLSGTGAASLIVPEEFGGVGGTEVDLCAVLEEAGRACVPDALLEALLIGPSLIAEAGSEEQRARWLPAIASGELRVTVALGGTPVVPDAHVSDLVLLERDGEVQAYARDELDLTRVHSMDPSRRLFRVAAHDGAGEALPGGGAALAGARTRQYAGSAAVLIGLSEELLHRSVEYARTRHQFDRPIGSFQAVKHQLAQATSLVSLAGRAVRAALYFVATDDERAEESALLARICAVEAEFEANRVALQTHGGIGFTWEHDLQMWLKRGKALEQAHGGHREPARRAGAVAVEGKVSA